MMNNESRICTGPDKLLGLEKTGEPMDLSSGIIEIGKENSED